MYYEVGIQKLSDNQLSKLRNGHPVRIKLGNAHKISLSIQQLKKLQKAHKKGSATTIVFDPYQLEQHGSGVFGDIAKKAKAFVKKYKLQDVVNPIINRVKKESHKGVSKLSNLAHSKINELQPVEQGEGILGNILSVVGNLAKSTGLGVRKHTATPARKARRTRKGKGLLGDIAKAGMKAIATKGIEVGSDYLKDKVAGMGVIAKHRRIAGRKAVASKKKKTFSGTALMPAGY
jgi:hypothetical protein